MARIGMGGGSERDSAADVPDGQLLARFCGEDDAAAFAVLLRRYGPMVWGVCRRLLGDGPDAEDAFQATFLVLIRKAPSLARPELLGNFLYGVAHRTALKARTSAARRRAHESRAAVSAEVQPADTSLWSELRPVLDEELNRLPARYRIPVVLYYLEGLTQEEIGRRLGCPRQTIATRLARACDRLRGRLTRRGVTLSAAVLATVLTTNAVRGELPAAVTEAALRIVPHGLTHQAMATGLVPASIAALTKGVLRDMRWRRLRMVLVGVVAAVVLAAGAGVWGYRALAGKPAADQKEKDKPAAKNPIRQTVEQFLAAAFAGKVEDARALAEPDKISVKQVQEFTSGRLRAARLPLGIPSLHADDTQALAVTEKVTVRNPRGLEEGPVLITLDRTEKGWRVRDLDFGKTEKRIAAFRKKHPDAKPVP